MSKPVSLIVPEQALSGRSESLSLPAVHAVNGVSFSEYLPENFSVVQLAMGCFWGAERKFWTIPGVHFTAVTYAGGYTPNPTYEEVCSGLTAHTEAVLVVYDPSQITLDELLIVFWENHDATQGMRQGNDIGTQYRSAIYLDNEQDLVISEHSAAHFQQRLNAHNLGTITSEIRVGVDWYFAETYHQQYLHKNPNGYCGLGGCGVSFS